MSIKSRVAKLGAEKGLDIMKWTRGKAPSVSRALKGVKGKATSSDYIRNLAKTGGVRKASKAAKYALLKGKLAGILGKTVAGGMAGVVGAGLAGAYVINRARKKTNKTIDDNTKATMRQADDLIKNIKRKQQKKASKKSANRAAGKDKDLEARMKSVDWTKWR